MDHVQLARAVAVSTRFSLVCGFLELPTERFTDYELTLQPELARYAELALSARFDQCGLTTIGDGPDFVDRVAQMMARWGISEDEVGRFRRTTHFLEPYNVFTQLEVSRDGSWSFRWYQRRRPPVERVAALSVAEGDDAQAIDTIKAVAQALQKRTVHFYSRKIAGTSASTRFYFSQYARDPIRVRDRVRAACDAALGTPAALDAAIRLLRLPKNATAYLGATLSTSGIERLKLTTPGFPPPGIFAVMDLLGHERQRVEWLANIEQVLDADGPDYIGIDATPQQIDRVKLYYQISSQPIGHA